MSDGTIDRVRMVRVLRPGQLHIETPLGLVVVTYERGIDGEAVAVGATGAEGVEVQTTYLAELTLRRVAGSRGR